MLTYILLLLIGILFLYGGGELLIRGAVSAAQRLGVSPLFSGLVIVGFGTSSPELIVSLQAALQGSSDIATGNIIGSNISNILLILGVSAMVAPLDVAVKTLKRDGTALLGSVLLLLLLLMDGVIGLGGGLILVVSLLAYIVYAYMDERRMESHVEASGVTGSHLKPVYLILIQIASGLILLITGSGFLIDGATGIALFLNLSEALIGLTVVALGTSIPELTVSVVAVWREETDIAIGNVLGSCIYNVLGILGITSIFSSLTIAHRMILFDQWVLLAVTILFVIFMATRQRVTRIEGVISFSGYVAYIAASVYLG